MIILFLNVHIQLFILRSLAPFFKIIYIKWFLSGLLRVYQPCPWIIFIIVFQQILALDFGFACYFLLLFVFIVIFSPLFWTIIIHHLIEWLIIVFFRFTIIIFLLLSFMLFLLLSFMLGVQFVFLQEFQDSLFLLCSNNHIML